MEERVKSKDGPVDCMLEMQQVNPLLNMGQVRKGVFKQLT
jgi:hypothetical protein